MKNISASRRQDLKARQMAPLVTPSDLRPKAAKDIAGAMNGILADVFALYLKTKNFHWHMSGPHFRDYHLLLDEQADQLYAMTDPIAERIRKVGGTTLRPLDTSRVPNAFRTTMPSMSNRSTCSLSCVMTTRCSRRDYAKLTMYATSTRTLPRLV